MVSIKEKYKYCINFTTEKISKIDIDSVTKEDETIIALNYFIKCYAGNKEIKELYKTFKHAKRI